MSNLIKESSAVELVRFFRAAAEQRRILEPRRGDRRWILEGHKVIHAIDADIVKLYTNPFDNAIRNNRRPYGYAEVFPGDDQKTDTINLGQALANFIFFQLQNQNSLPLLILPPIDHEIREIFRAILQEAILQGVKAREQILKIKKSIDQISLIKNKSDRTHSLIELAPDLFSFLVGPRGPRPEIHRFAELAKKKCILPLDHVFEKPDILNEYFGNTFKLENNFKELESLIDRSRYWYNQITKRPRAKNNIRIHDDSMMLAYLETLNQRLDQNKVRLVLITGDQSIHETAHLFTPEGANRTFANLWLRHPRSYLAEPEILSPERESVKNETDFVKWLDTFLGKLELTGSDYMASLEKLLKDETFTELTEKATNVLETHPNILDEFKERWANYTCLAILSHYTYIPNSFEFQDNKKSQQLINKINEQLYDVEEILKNEISESWNAIFNSAIEVGYLFARQNSIQRPRNPPVLFFDSLPTAREIVRKILTADKKNQIHDFTKKLAKLREEDDSGYTYTLVFGMLFASQGSWSVATILGDRALKISQSNTQYYITGREAFYLKAVACRLQIRSASSLSNSANLLRKAEDCLAKERKNRPDLLNFDYRFATEREALNLHYHLFQIFCNEKIPKSIPSLNDIKSKLIELLQKNFHFLCLIDIEECRKWVVRNVERKLIINLFMIVLLEANPKKIFPQELKPYLKRLKESVENKNNEEEIPRTYFVDAIYLVTCWWEEKDSNIKNELWNKLSLMLSNEKIKIHSIMPYDWKRFSRLREFIGHK